MTADTKIWLTFLAAFHTGFNLCNAALFIGLVNPLEQLATRWVAKPRLQRRRGKPVAFHYQRDTRHSETVRHGSP